MYTSSLHMVSNNVRLTKADKRMVITPLGSHAHSYPIDVQASSRKSFTLATSQVSSSLLHWISSLPQDSPCFYHQEGLLIPILQAHVAPLEFSTLYYHLNPLFFTSKICSQLFKNTLSLYLQPGPLLHISQTYLSHLGFPFPVLPNRLWSSLTHTPSS